MNYSDLLFGTSAIDRAYTHWYTSPHLFGGDVSAFHEHMPTLRLLCAGKRVVELGSRYGVSTLAILSARPASLLSVDIEKKESVTWLEQLARDEHIPFTFVEANDLEIEIPECDILFIDTLHDYAQLGQELALHADKAQKWIIGHDLVSFGGKDESNPHGPGLIPALEEFMAEHVEWQSAGFYFNCNGLWLLRRTPR